MYGSTDWTGVDLRSFEKMSPLVRNAQSGLALLQTQTVGKSLWDQSEADVNTNTPTHRC